MEKLYEIQVQHCAPKDSHTSTQAYLIANNDEEVYEWIKSDPMPAMCTSWEDREEEDGPYDIYNDDYEVIGTETFKEKMLRIKGDLYDEDQDWSDAYYGLTFYGWREVGPITPEQIQTMNQLGIINKV